mmetsp:Transcript_64965/g.103388  ORF Transcript_64965/g.103388 Transcript_64965/m.103388 type:complete len:226 (+) Transcript_64965:1042-1719(+)
MRGSLTGGAIRGLLEYCSCGGACPFCGGGGTSRVAAAAAEATIIATGSSILPFESVVLISNNLAFSSGLMTAEPCHGDGVAQNSCLCRATFCHGEGVVTCSTPSRLSNGRACGMEGELRREAPGSDGVAISTAVAAAFTRLATKSGLQGFSRFPKRCSEASDAGLLGTACKAVPAARSSGVAWCKMLVPGHDCTCRSKGEDGVPGICSMKVLRTTKFSFFWFCAT